jgi:hypothetical protein
LEVTASVPQLHDARAAANVVEVRIRAFQDGLVRFVVMVCLSGDRKPMHAGGRPWDHSAAWSGGRKGRGDGAGSSMGMLSAAASEVPAIRTNGRGGIRSHEGLFSAL